LAKLASVLQQEKDNKIWDLSNLTLLASGGEDNDINTCLEVSSILHKYQAPQNVIAPGFGMTETCAGAIFNLDCPDYDVKRGQSVASLGTCINGIEMRITTPGSNQRLTTSNEPGNLELRGSIVFKGYYSDPHATAESFTLDGWFPTGDLAMIDRQGYLKLVGRIKDIVNISGVKFAMAPIQTALEQALSSRVTRLVTCLSRLIHTEQVIIAYIPRSWNTPSDEVLKIEDLAVQTCQLQVVASPLIFPL
jgi:long-subunit acyl-CoA synthetase (AMP-forming)